MTFQYLKYKYINDYKMHNSFRVAGSGLSRVHFIFGPTTHQTAAFKPSSQVLKVFIKYFHRYFEMAYSLTGSKTFDDKGYGLVNALEMCDMEFANYALMN
jgi:hypothetical protein